MESRIVDDKGRFVFGHGFVDMANHELFEIGVGGRQTEQRIQMLPIVNQ